MGLGLIELFTPKVGKVLLKIIFLTLMIPTKISKLKVIASEDWKGMREDFKTASDIMEFKLEFTPKLKNPPVVKERRIRLQAPKVALGSGGRPRRSPLFEEIGQTPAPPRPPPVKIPYNIW